VNLTPVGALLYDVVMAMLIIFLALLIASFFERK